MAANDLPSVLSSLFTAPTEAVVIAAAETRRIWVNWLKDMKRLVDSADGQPEIQKKIIRKHMELAPVWKMSAQVSVGISMRVASINRIDARLSLGLGIGPVQVSGGFGFMAESSSESMMNARAQYALSNETEVTLTDYLDSLGITVDASENVDTAIQKLGLAATPLIEETDEDE